MVIVSWLIRDEALTDVFLTLVIMHRNTLVPAIEIRVGEHVAC